MDIIVTLAAGPWGVGWQEVVMVLLIIGIFTVPGIVTLTIFFFVIRRQRRKRSAQPPLPGQYSQQP
jgi:hypothetical protein